MIEALAERSEGPPHVHLTVCIFRASILVLVNIQDDVLVKCMAMFARLKNVLFEYEILVEEQVGTLACPRSAFGRRRLWQ